MKKFNNLFFVSIIIPSRNEEKLISKCLDAITEQDYPKDKIEILVIDGMSEDETRKIVKSYGKKYPFITLLDNPGKITPKAMNIGIKKSKGDVVIFVNAHSFLDKDFLRWSVYCLQRIKDTDAVGGKLKAVSEDKILSKTIGFVSDSVFGSGGTRYRQMTKEGFVRDTIPYCAYREEVFKRIGLIDEDLIRGNDAEFNLRLLKSGGKIYFSPEIKSYLYSRPSLRKFYKQQFQYGYFKVKIAQKLGWKSIFRQVIPGVFVLSLILSIIMSIFLRPFLFLFILILGIYFSINIFFSLQIGFKYGLKYFFPALFLFSLLHFSYGLGFLKGIFDFLFLNRKIKKDIGITR